MIVAIDNLVAEIDVHCFKYDDVAIGRLATDYLLGKGHRRIAFFQWRSEFATFKDRLRGYIESHKAHGLSSNPDFVFTAPKSLADWHDSLLAPLFRTAKPPCSFNDSLTGMPSLVKPGASPKEKALSTPQVAGVCSAWPISILL